MPAQRAGRRAGQAQRVRRAGRARVDRPGLPRRPRADPVGPVPAHDPHRADQGARAARSTTTSSSGPIPTSRSRPSTPSTPRRSGEAPSRVGGRTWRWATRSAPWSRARSPSPTWSAGTSAWAWASTASSPCGSGHKNRPRIPRFFHRDDLNVPDVMQRVHWDPEFARRSRQPHHLRLRPHARDLAHPPVHRLDGRRRLAVEARLRVPQVQLRGRHPVALGHGDRHATWPTGPPGRRPRPAGREPARRAHHARPRHHPAAQPRARDRCACPSRRAAPATSSRR